jgi:hypothetical protein
MCEMLNHTIFAHVIVAVKKTNPSSSVHFQFPGFFLLKKKMGINQS